MRGKYKTPKRSNLIKARLSADEKEAFDRLLASSGMSQTEYIREAVFHAKVSPQIIYSCSDAELDAYAALIAEFGKIGSNLNQIAKYLNEGGSISGPLKEKIKTALLDLDDLKYALMKKAGR